MAYWDCSGRRHDSNQYNNVDSRTNVDLCFDFVCYRNNIILESKSELERNTNSKSN